jgi:hydroxypyruvate isomerase
MYGTITEGLKQSAAYAEESGVTLALENHGRITNNIDTLMGILKEVGSESLKVNIDIGNFYWFGYKLSEVETILKKLVPMTAHTHMKNGTTDRKEERRKTGDLRFTPLTDGDINLVKVVKLLKTKGYEGAISMEDEFEGWASLPLEKVMEILKRDADYLRAAM